MEKKTNYSFAFRCYIAISLGPGEGQVLWLLVFGYVSLFVPFCISQSD